MLDPSLADSQRLSCQGKNSLLVSSLATASLNADDFNAAEFGCGKSIVTVIMYSSVGTASISDWCVLIRMYARVRLNSVSILQPEEMTMVWYVSEKMIKWTRFAGWAAGIEPGWSTSVGWLGVWVAPSWHFFPTLWCLGKKKQKTKTNPRGK